MNLSVFLDSSFLCFLFPYFCIIVINLYLMQFYSCLTSDLLFFELFTEGNN